MSPLETTLDLSIALRIKQKGSDDVYSLYPITRDIDVALTSIGEDNALTLDDKIAIYDAKHADTERRITALEDAGTASIYAELQAMLGHDDSISISNNDTTRISMFSVVSAPKLTTSRSLIIGNASKFFDGSSDVSWTLSEIGAAASDHTHNYAGSSSAGGAATSALACTGNSATATKLATAITLNGTSFDGSANITTTNWGTSRTITVGNTGKSVNGSGDVSWTLSEIGAAASDHTHSYADDLTPLTVAECEAIVNAS